MSVRTDDLFQHCSVDGLIETILARKGVNQLELIGGMLLDPDGAEQLEDDVDGEAE